MKSRGKQEAETTREFLEQLAKDRGPILTDDEYENVRSSVLRSLANPPRVEWAVAAPGLISILIGIGLLVAVLLTWITAPEDTTMSRLIVGLLFVGLGSYFFFGNLLACRASVRRSYGERITEINDLFQSGLISKQEHETIRQAIEHKGALRVQNAKT